MLDIQLVKAYLVLPGAAFVLLGPVLTADDFVSCASMAFFIFSAMPSFQPISMVVPLVL